MALPENFKLNFVEGELRKNLPILIKTDCSGAAGIFSMDGKTAYEDFEFIPLRLDYTRDSYEGKKLGLLLCVAIAGETSTSKNGKKVRIPIPIGLTFYLMLKPSRTMQGSLDNFLAMRSAVEQMMKTRSCGLIWACEFEIKSGSAIGPSGESQPIKYARVSYLIRPVDEENELEIKLINSLSSEFSTCELFSGVSPLDNEIISQFDELARESEVKRFESSVEQRQLPQSSDYN
ncbi:hypothetical protein [Limnoraphis robusta]|uniref:Uncharacterized protein n=1 Tax=Limnoraphis robusta CCNP1315 TaxID=3110306 RepID=A0ABU5U6T2_9CYAN|nr:hypothetical protein [Limnoraphis robusta]MEA5522869.1 hypothetical protein [Limnoraphis robusta CCNP1315]MEA5546869.1 hypothetical protein [Limnoraphis robusta CCNP1324]